MAYPVVPVAPAVVAEAPRAWGPRPADTSVADWEKMTAAWQAYEAYLAAFSAYEDELEEYDLAAAAAAAGAQEAERRRIANQHAALTPPPASDTHQSPTQPLPETGTTLVARKPLPDSIYLSEVSAYKPGPTIPGRPGDKRPARPGTVMPRPANIPQTDSPYLAPGDLNAALFGIDPGDILGAICTPADWAKSPANTPPADVARLDGGGSRQGEAIQYGVISGAANDGANWAYNDGGGWKVDTKRCPDKSVVGNVVSAGVFQAGTGEGTQTPTGTQITPKGPGTAIAACGPKAPVITQRRTCGRGYILAIDGMCYPKALLPNALRENRPKRALVSYRDGQVLNKAVTVARRLKNVGKKAARVNTTKSGR